MFRNKHVCTSISDTHFLRCMFWRHQLKNIILCFWKYYKYMKNTNVIRHMSYIQHTKKCVINTNIITVCQHTCSDINMPSNSSISTYSFRYQHTLSFAHDTAVIISTNIIKLVSITKWYRNIHVEYQHTSWWISIN